MRIRTVSAYGSAKLAIAASVIAFAFLVGSLVNVEHALRGDFDAALADHEQDIQRDLAINASSDEQNFATNLAASEDVWLGHAGRVTAATKVSWSRGVDIGDTVTIASQKGDRVLRVEGIAELPAGALGEAGAHDGQPFYIVTARETGRAGGLVMRFVVNGADESGAILHRAADATDRNL